MEVFGGASRSTASSGGFSPIQAPGCRFTWSPRLLFLELLPPSRSGCGSFRCPSCSFHPAPAWFSSETSASWVLTVASAPDSERTFAFGRSLCLVSGSTPSSLVSSWCGGLGACLPFFPFPFPFGVVIPPGLMDRELEGFFPSGCFLFQLWGCPASALAVAGEGGSVLRAHPLFGMVAWCLFKSLLFPSYTTRCRYDVPGVMALRQVLVAMLAEGALESPLVLVLAFHSSLFLVEGSSDGSAPGDRFLSPGRMCSFTPFRLRSVASVLPLPGSGLFFLLWICRFTVGSSGAVPRGNFWGFP